MKAYPYGLGLTEGDDDKGKVEQAWVVCNERVYDGLFFHLSLFVVVVNACFVDRLLLPCGNGLFHKTKFPSVGGRRWRIVPWKR